MKKGGCKETGENGRGAGINGNHHAGKEGGENGTILVREGSADKRISVNL